MDIETDRSLTRLRSDIEDIQNDIRWIAKALNMLLERYSTKIRDDGKYIDEYDDDETEGVKRVIKEMEQ